jgi:hypothetical protein
LRVDDHWEVWMVAEEAMIVKTGQKQSFIYCRGSTPDSKVETETVSDAWPSRLGDLSLPQNIPLPSAKYGRVGQKAADKFLARLGQHY